MSIYKREKLVAGSNTTVICIHGNSASSEIFQPVFDKSDLNCNLIAFDLPGHGLSPKNESYDLDLFKKTVLDISNSVEGSVILVGNSFGGHLVLEVAEQVKNLAGFIVFGSPPARVPLNMAEGFLPVPQQGVFFNPAATEIEIEAVLDICLFEKKYLKELKDDFLRADPSFRLQLGQSVAQGAAFGDEVAALFTLNCKKTILQGTAEPFTNPEYLKTLQNENKSEFPFELQFVEECGHFISVEKPEIVIAAIQKMLN